MLFPTSVLANAGIPMIVITFPLMLICLLPVIIIEAYILKKQLNISTKESIISSTIANSFSTIIGIPLTWAALTLIPILTSFLMFSLDLPIVLEKIAYITLLSSWISVPYQYESDLIWIVPAATLFLFLPFFFASWKIESFIIKKIHPTINSHAINAACKKGHIITYSLMTLFPLYFLIKGLL